MSEAAKAPARGRSSWRLRRGDLPPARAMRSERSFRGLQHNAAFRLIALRRRRAPPIWMIGASISILILGSGAVAGYGFGVKDADATFDLAVWLAMSASIYLLHLAHGEARFTHGWRSPYAAPFAPPLGPELAECGYPGLDAAEGLWGALSSRSRLAGLLVGSLATATAGAAILILLPWRANAMALCAVFAAAYYAALDFFFAPRSTLAAALVAMKVWHERFTPKPGRKGPARAYGEIMWAVIMYLTFTAFWSIVGGVIAVPLWMTKLPKSGLAGATVHAGAELVPLGVAALALGAALGAAKGFYLYYGAEDYLAEVAELAEQTMRWAGQEAEFDPRPNLWKINPRVEREGVGD